MMMVSSILFSKAKRISYLSASIFSLMTVNSFASSLEDKIYFEIKRPIHSKILGKSNEENVSHSNGYNIGFGYIISDHINFDINSGELSYDSEEVYLSDDTLEYAQANILTKRHFENYCKHRGWWFTRKEMCGDFMNFNSTKLNTLILSMKWSPFGKGKRFSPYFVGGAGGVLATSKMNQIDKSDPKKGRSKETNTRTTFGFEVGIGTKISITNRANLEISAKYFDYGKHFFKQDIKYGKNDVEKDIYSSIYKKINGYSISVGISCTF